MRTCSLYVPLKMKYVDEDVSANPEVIVECLPPGPIVTAPVGGVVKASTLTIARSKPARREKTNILAIEDGI